MLNEVRLLKHDSCYTYVLKRVGMYTLENSLLESNEFVKKCEWTTVEDLNTLFVGDILIYIDDDLERCQVNRPGLINSHGIIYDTRAYYNLHFMVYEGKIEGRHTVSDCYAITDNLMSTMELRIRDLETLKHSWVKLLYGN